MATSRRSPIRRHARRSVLVLLLGALTTLGLAWGAPLVLGTLSARGVPPASPDILWTDGERGGHYRVYRHPLIQRVDFKRIIFTGPVEELPYYNRNPPPWWAGVVSLDQREGFEQVETAAAGWPFLAFKMERWTSWRVAPPGQPTLILIPGREGQSISVQPVPAPPTERVLGLLNPQVFGVGSIPLLVWPLWSGLVLNVIVFAAAWAAILAVIGWGLCRRRRARDCCIDCGYDRRGLAVAAACPECGRLEPSSSV